MRHAGLCAGDRARRQAAGLSGGLRTFALLLSAGLATAATAQTPPSGAAGELLRRQQAIAGQRAPEETPTLTAPAAAAPAPSAPGELRRFDRALFPKSPFLGAAELQALASPYLGHPIDTADLARLIAAINALYAQRGIATAQAVLPPQAGDGVLRIDLIEGKLGVLRVGGDTYVRAAYLRHQAHLAEGETIDTNALRRSLWRFNRLSDVQLSATLTPGDAVGLTDITLDASAPRRDQLTLFVDNHAYGATGTYEGGLLYRHTGVLGLDDRLSALVTGARGAITGTTSYDVPLGFDGTRMGLSYGHSVTRVIAGAYAGFGSKGIADSVLGEIVQPLWSDKRWMVLAAATGGYSRARNYLSDRLISSTGTTRGGLGLTLIYQGSARAMTLGVNAAYAHGAIDNDRAVGSYPLISGSVALTQELPGAFSLTASSAWQWTDATGLPSDLLFQIGGPTTVRGYTQGALAGDKGYYVEGQINYALPEKGSIAPTLYGFVDRGHVTASFTQPSGLLSAGAGVSVRIGRRLTAEANIGHALINGDLGPGKVHGYARITWDLFP